MLLFVTRPACLPSGEGGREGTHSAKSCLLSRREKGVTRSAYALSEREEGREEEGEEGGGDN